MNRGAIEQIGAPAEIYAKPANRFVADFIGVNNLLDATVRAVAADRLRVDTPLGELATLRDERFRPGDRCVVCVRPENVTLGGGAGNERNVIKGQIGFAAYLGNTLRYDLDVGSSTLAIQAE
jgi:iron(III) transport system ATP-binding protein